MESGKTVGLNESSMYAPEGGEENEGIEGYEEKGGVVLSVVSDDDDDDDDDEDEDEDEEEEEDEDVGSELAPSMLSGASGSSTTRGVFRNVTVSPPPSSRSVPALVVSAMRFSACAKQSSTRRQATSIAAEVLQSSSAREGTKPTWTNQAHHSALWLQSSSTQWRRVSWCVGGERGSWVTAASAKPAFMRDSVTRSGRLLVSSGRVEESPARLREERLLVYE